MKEFFISFMAAFIGSIAVSFLGGRGFDTLGQMLEIYVFTPSIIGLGFAFSYPFFKRNKNNS